jgi:hypothetical protein
MSDEREMYRACCLLSCLLLLCAAAGTQAAELQVQGTWELALDAGFLSGGPGSGLNATQTSGRQAIAVSIINTGGRSWSLSAYRAIAGWPRELALSCRRTGDGLGALAPRGGAAFVAVTDGPQTLFTGTGDVLGMPLQLQLSGVTLQLGPCAHDLSITLQVEETP